MELQKSVPEKNDSAESSPTRLVDQTTTEITPNSDIPASEIPRKTHKRTLFLLILIVLIGIGISGFMLVNKDEITDLPKNTVTQKYEIQNLKVGIQSDNIMNELPENDNFYSTTMSIFYQTHEALVSFESLTQIKPRIAESWTNPDDLTWTFKIANNRTFHTGKKLTAKDIVACLNAEKDSGFWDTSFATIDTIELDANDDTKIIIKTISPDSVLLNRLTVLPIYDIDYESGKSWASGTGAYTLKDGVPPTAESLELTADDSYPLGKPSVRTISYTNHFDDETYSKNILDGKFDLANIESIDSTKFDNNNNLKVTKIKSLGSFFASLNNDRPDGPLKDIKVREALSYIIQGKQFVDSADSEVATQIVPSEVPGYSTSIKGYVYNLEKATSLLAEAGYETPSELSVKVGYFAGAQDDDANILISQLEAAGITVVVESADSGANFVTAINNEQYDIMLYSYSSGINDITDIALDVAGSAGIYSQYANTKVDSLVSLANSEFDQTKRLSKLQDINKEIAADFGIIPLRTSIYNLVQKNSIVCPEDIPGTDYICYFWKTYSSEL